MGKRKVGEVRRQKLERKEWRASMKEVQKKKSWK